MILGIGADVVNIQRVKRALQVSPALRDRIFTQAEQLAAQKLGSAKKMAYYAKRFAAKEALSKACGTGIGADIGWLDMCVLNDKKGAPVATFSPKALRFLEKKFKTKKIRILLSLTDETEYAMAFAVLDNA